MTNSLNYSVSSYTLFARTSPPICEKFTATLSNNRWVLEGLGCYDPQNGLVSYQYGYQDQSGAITWITVLTYTTPITLRIKSSATFAVMKVRTSDQTSTNYYYNITGASRRRLDVVSDFELDTQDSDQIPASIVYFAPLANNASTLSYIYNTTYAYFTTTTINQDAFNSYLNCAQVLVNSDYIYKALATNLANLIYKLINDYDAILMNSEINGILDIISSASGLIDDFTTIDLLNLLGLNFRTNSVPGLSFNYTSSKLVFYVARLNGYNLRSYSINLPTAQLIVPSDVKVSSSDVVDFSFAQFDSSAEIFYLNTTKSGDYKNYTLKIFSKNLVTDLSASSDFSLVLFGNYTSSTGYQCLELDNLNWESGNCSVYKVNSQNITLHFKSDSVYTIRPNNYSCDVGSGPIATMSVLIFLMIVLSLIFFVTDKVVKTVPLLIFKPLLVYPLTGLFFKQPNPLRVALITQLLTCELLLLALIGAFHQHFDDPTKPNDFTFADYYGSQMSRGAAAWALCQVFTIPIYFINAYNVYKKKKLHYITLPICIIMSLLCFGAIVAMTTQYCAGITKFWIVNFLIFLLLDITTLEIIYALITTYILYRRFVHGSKEITSGISLEEDNKKDPKSKLTPDEKVEVSKTSRPLILDNNDPEILVEESFYQIVPNSDLEN